MFLRRIREHIDRNSLLDSGACVLVGVSGGLDSVVLLKVLHELGHALEAAHVNFGLRGEESDQDEVFVRAVCEKLSVRVHVTSAEAELRSTTTGISTQMAAREFRYEFFGEVAQAAAIDRVALAHHMDDQAETVLNNLFSGTGPEGLAGMPVSRPLAPGSAVRVVRPLLGVTRTDIEVWARKHRITWREDSTNRSSKYRRAVLRTEVLPVLAEHWGPDAARTIARSAELMRAYVDGEFESAVESRFAFVSRPNVQELDSDALATLPSVWRRRMLLEALRRWLPAVRQTAAIARELEQLLSSQVGRRVEFAGGLVRRERGSLIFSEHPSEEPGNNNEILPVHPGRAVALKDGSVCVDILDYEPDDLSDGAPQSVFADALRLRFPLRVRRWRAGDSFRPLGMLGAKKVSDFLCDTKIQSNHRRDVFLLLSGDDVVWVVGRRLSESFKVTESTTRFARLSYAAT